MTIYVLRIVLVFTVLGVLYLALLTYMRWHRRCVLHAEYDAGAAPSLTREDYIAKGLAAFERSWERKALYVVFLLPLVVGAILVGIAQIA